MEINSQEINKLSKTIIGCAFTVHRALGFGFLEKIYKNSLGIELAKTQLKFELEKPINVLYDKKIVGEYFADILVEDKIIVELKAVSALNESHWAQCLNYLKATGLPICLLLNFGSKSVQIKRFVNPQLKIQLDLEN